MAAKRTGRRPKGRWSKGQAFVDGGQKDRAAAKRTGNLLVRRQPKRTGTYGRISLSTTAIRKRPKKKGSPKGQAFGRRSKGQAFVDGGQKDRAAAKRTGNLWMAAKRTGRRPKGQGGGQKDRQFVGQKAAQKDRHLWTAAKKDRHFVVRRPASPIICPKRFLPCRFESTNKSRDQIETPFSYVPCRPIVGERNATDHVVRRRTWRDPLDWSIRRDRGRDRRVPHHHRDSECIGIFESARQCCPFEIRSWPAAATRRPDSVATASS